MLLALRSRNWIVSHCPTTSYLKSRRIVRTLDGERLNVTDLSYYGEYSGTYWDEFEKLLEQSTGTLKARVVWEGGDSVEVVTIENGEITREEL